MIQTDLTELILRARAGNPQAQEELISDIQNRVYYHCKKMMKNESDAQDAAQDVLVTVLTSLDKLREPAAFYGWVNGITANRCRHLLTQGTREWQMPEDEDGGSMLDDLEDLDQKAIPDAVLDDRETQRLLMGIIDNLPPEQRESVLFYYYDEMSVKEIAQAMEVSEGTVKSRLNYARKSIKAGVEDLEKRGTKLYGLAPLPLLLFLLRREAAGFALGAEQGARLTATVLSKAKAVGVGAAAASGASGGAAAAGGTAAKAGLSIAAKIGIGIAAVALAGGLIVGGTALLGDSEETPAPTPEPTFTVESAPLPTESPTESPEPAGQSEELLALLDSIVYYGDKEQCKLTRSQAAAFAEVLRQQADIIEERARTNSSFNNDYVIICRAALFDVGDGATALFFGGGATYGWMGEYTDQWAEVGGWGIWEYRDGRAVPYWDMEPGSYFIGGMELRESCLCGVGGSGDGYGYSGSVYPLTGGAIPTDPITSAMYIYDWDTGIYTYQINGAEVSEAEFFAWQEQWTGQPVLCGHFADGGIGGRFTGLGEAAAMADALERYAGTEAVPSE